VALRATEGAAVVVVVGTTLVVVGGVEPFVRGTLVVVGASVVVVVERAGAVTADSEPSESCTAVELKLSSPASPTTVPATTICARFMWAFLVVSSCAFLQSPKRRTPLDGFGRVEHPVVTGIRLLLR